MLILLTFFPYVFYIAPITLRYLIHLMNLINEFNPEINFIPIINHSSYCHYYISDSTSLFQAIFPIIFR